jgi:hypothetical protein
VGTDFVDHLYLSFTNAAAFSPTDTMPMTRWAKMAMLTPIGSIPRDVAGTTRRNRARIAAPAVALVIARAINILKP